MTALQRGAAWTEERLLGALRQSVPQNGRVHLLIIELILAYSWSFSTYDGRMRLISTYKDCHTEKLSCKQKSSNCKFFPPVSSSGPVPPLTPFPLFTSPFVLPFFLLWDPRSGRTPKWGFGVALLPAGALCFYQAHFGRTVLPKWPFWAHLFYSVFYSVSEFGRVCFRQARVAWAMLPPGALFRAGAFAFLPCAPKSHLYRLPHSGPKKPWQPQTWQDLTRFSPLDFSLLSPDFRALVLLNYAENLEKKQKIQWRASSGDGAPKLQISVPCRGRTCPDTLGAFRFFDSRKTLI